MAHLRRTLQEHLEGRVSRLRQPARVHVSRNVRVMLGDIDIIDTGTDGDLGLNPANVHLGHNGGVAVALARRCRELDEHAQTMKNSWRI